MKVKAYKLPLKNRGGEVVAYALVSPGDIEWARRFTWSRTPSGYAQRGKRIDGKVHIFYMAREVLGLAKGDKRQADHINRDKLDNRRENLRTVSQAENAQNKDSFPNSSSRFRGVCWDKHNNRWKATGRIHDELHNLGFFKDEEQAGQVAAEFRATHMTHAAESPDLPPVFRCPRCDFEAGSPKARCPRHARTVVPL